MVLPVPPVHKVIRDRLASPVRQGPRVPLELMVLLVLQDRKGLKGVPGSLVRLGFKVQLVQ
jgi:hypothetical protein